MDIKATLVEKVSKNGNPYKVIELYLTDTYKKLVFLDDAELELLKIVQSELDKPLSSFID